VPRVLHSARRSAVAARPPERRDPSQRTYRMRSVDPVDLTIHPASRFGRATEPAPAQMGPLTGRVTDRGTGVVGLSTAPGDLPRDLSAGLPPGRPWSIPLLVTPEAEAWLLGWPAGFTTAPHAHRGTGSALTIVEGSLSEEC